MIDGAARLVGDALALALELVLLAGLWRLASRAIGRWMPSVDAGARITATGLLVAAGVACTLQAFGFAGMLRVGLGVLAAVGLWGLRPTGAGWPPARVGPLDVGLAPVAVALAALAVQLGRALARVPVEWDGLTYHLFFPAVYLEENGIVRLVMGRPIDQATHYPQNGELLFAALMAGIDSDLLVAASMVVWCGLCGLATARLARDLGASRVAAAVAGALTPTLPALLSRAASSYVEPLLVFAVVTAVAFGRRALGSDEPKERLAWAGLAGLAIGLAVGTKLTALPWLAALGACFLLGLVPRRAGPRRLAALLLFVGAALLPAAGWLARNAWLAGNPFYPAPFAGLPHLERIDLRWRDATPWAQRERLADLDLFGDALFGLPPDRNPPMTLGPFAFAALVLSGVTLAWILPAFRDRLREKRPAHAAALLVAPLALAAGILGWLATPFWLNIGLLRSLVRTATPAAALAFALAAPVLDRLRAPRLAIAIGGAAAVAAQIARAGVVHGLDAATSALGVLALALAALAAGVAGPRRRWRTLAAVAAWILLVGAWQWRDATRAERWLAATPEKQFARAALAAERLAPGRATALFASDLNFEFLYLFQGPRLERRLVWLDPKLFDSGAAWLATARATGADLLIASRWLVRDGRWAVESRWAEEAGLAVAWEEGDVRIFRFAPAAGNGG